jgi:RNA polymerase sigma factor (sigma-70 family)
MVENTEFEEKGMTIDEFFDYIDGIKNTIDQNFNNFVIGILDLNKDEKYAQYEHEKPSTWLWLEKSYVGEALDHLTGRERKIIQLRFGLIYTRELTWKETAKIAKITPYRVRQQEAKALRKLRQWIRNHPNDQV